MESKAINAIVLTLIMFLSGCMSSDSSDKEEVTDVQDTAPTEIEASLNLTDISGDIAVNDIVVIEGIVDISPIETKRNYEYDLISPSGIRTIETTLTDYGENVQFVFMPDEPGEWSVVIRLIVEGVNDSVKEQISFDVTPPDEGDTVLSVEPVIELENSAPIKITGKVLHSDVSTCTISDGTNSQTADSNGDFSLSQGLIEESYNATITATCGKWTITEDSRLVRVVLLSGNDMDGDGIPDNSDSCPNGYGEDEGWNPNSVTDRDNDGCHDYEEDFDDDNDLIPDADDDCASEIGWMSTTENDYDRDGCSDVTEDEDDDNDGITDLFDSCPTGEIGWESKPYTDWDGDGCRDLSEDLDDDNDQVNDTIDDCWRGISNWFSNSEFDYDGDGCQDSVEDDEL